MLYNPKTEIFSALSGLNRNIAPHNSADFTDLPLITYQIQGNIPEYDLNSEILSQSVSVSIDLWAEDSEELTTMFEEVVTCMRNILYICEFSSEVPNIDATILHYATRFRKTV